MQEAPPKRLVLQSAEETGSWDERLATSGNGSRETRSSNVPFATEGPENRLVQWERPSN